jgi:pimeloyl-ACP methyl ester carboxylesterase
MPLFLYFQDMAALAVPPMRFAPVFLALLAAPALAQPAGDCPYPLLFLHGYTGSQASWEPFTSHPAVAAIWGPRADVFHALLNAYENEERIAGPDGLFGTTDDDVLVQFVNETNALQPGCVYADNFENWWNEDPSNPMIEVNGDGSPGGTFATESDSNEEAALKQGYALGRMIARVLEANPGRDRVILVGHSMGGLTAREYLQRRDGAGRPRWWVDPDAPGGHRVARLLTVGTPHRGSNFFGNPFLQGGPAPEDGVPDINSSATRDLRYNYFCLFCDSPGPYLFGGDEGNGFAWHTDDVNCDGDDDDRIQGINVDGRDQGFDDAWDGTTDNPAFPLPTDVRYTWLVSDEDGVVALSRQWLYRGGVPVPSDGVPHRLTDTLLTHVFHLDEQEDTDAVIRGLDEPDYPAHAYRLAPGLTYAGTATVRSHAAPDGPPTSDPDWYAFETAGGPVRVALAPSRGRSGRLDLYDAPPDPYTTAPSVLGVNFPLPPSRPVAVTAELPPGPHYVRVRHDGVGPADWQRPYRLTITAAPASPPLAAAQQPGVFALEPNAPNPFRERTVVPFHLPAEGPVALAVFDALGRRVAVLVDAVLPAGAHHAALDAAALAPGVYLLRLDAAGQTTTRRVIRAQ